MKRLLFDKLDFLVRLALEVLRVLLHISRLDITVSSITVVKL